MRQWVLDAEHWLDGTWSDQEAATQEKADSEKEEPQKNDWRVSNEQVSLRFDRWMADLTDQLSTGALSQIECSCLSSFLQTLANARPNMIQFYDQPVFPRTNNEMEGMIRRVKARYRRISVRKNWSTYLLRYGRSIVFYEWWQTDVERRHQFERLAQAVSLARWRQMRQETSRAHREQLKRFRFCHKRATYLSGLEKRWSAARSLLLH
jgi:hypothetical protein